MTNLFNYHFIDNQAAKTLFLLHGTGGTKHDFLFLDPLLQQQYNLVGIQGNIDENGMARFFKRHGHGQFDQASIAEETSKLAKFIAEWQAKHQLSPDSTYALGYSNGANILLALLATTPVWIGQAILLHPMLPFSLTDKKINLDQLRALVTTSPNDPIITPDQSDQVVQAMQKANAQLTHHQYPHGHQVSDDEISDVIDFLNA